MNRLIIGIVCIVVAACRSGYATDRTWSGTSSTDYTNGNNWAGGIVPDEVLDRAIFPSSLTPYQPTLMKDRSISGLIFQCTSGGWTLGGTGKTIYWGGISGASTKGGGLIDDSLNATGVDTINANLASEGTNTIIAGAGGLVVNGDIRVDIANGDFSVNGGTVTVARLAGSRDIPLNGNGTWVIANAANPNFTNNAATLCGSRVVIGNRFALGYKGNFQLGNQSTSTMLSASTDLTGANCITNNVLIYNNNSAKVAGVQGANSIEFGGLLYTGSGSSSYFLSNNIVSGKKLLVNNFCMNDNTSGKYFELWGSGETWFNGMIYSGTSTPNDNSFRARGTGLTVLNASNAFTGQLVLGAGSMLRLANSNSLNGGIGAAGGLVPISLQGGVLELGIADFLCSTGAAAGQVSISGGGWSAYGGKRVVNLGGAGVVMTYNTSTWLFSGNILMFNSAYADSEVEFRNPINLNGTSIREFYANDNPATNGDFATMSGVITNGGIVKTGPGMIVLSGVTNRFTSGMTVSNGTLVVSGVTTSTTMNVVSTGVAVVDGAYVGPITVGAGAALGGTGSLAVANVALASNSVLQVTILDNQGQSSALTFSGALNLTNVVLRVVNTNLLGAGQTYKVVNCGSHVNTFAASNLSANWVLDYSQAGYVQIRSAGYTGTLLKFQ